MSKLKNITGRMMALAVSLHSQAIRAQVSRAAVALNRATQERLKRNDDLDLVRRQFEDACDNETEAMVSYDAARLQAQSELEALPQLDGYRVRPNPPFGARPHIIDKRGE
jgi:predicted amidohydrolase